MSRRLPGALLALAFGAQSLAAFAGAKAQSCACTEALCCRVAKKPAPAACHHVESGSAGSLRCHHPAELFRLPVTIAVLPAPVALRPRWRTTILAPPAAIHPHEGFSRLDSPPPRPPRAG